MNVGERIKLRRKELNISADELAAKLKVSRSTVFRYEKGDIVKFPADALDPIAEALHTTVADLMGWGETKNPAEGEFGGLSEGEIDLISYYRVVNDEGKKKIYDYAKDLSEMEKYKKEESLISAG